MTYHALTRKQEHFFFNSEKNTFLFRLGIAGYNQDEFTFIICHNLH